MTIFANDNTTNTIRQLDANTP